ncbi:MAG: DUF2330 domain-containing protein [Deltaproteobacteria bacterium]|nr:DUF2330 domain-containing protein [Deltaproteobacteria bacterium]
MKTAWPFGFLLAALLLPSALSADMGQVHTDPAQVRETSQKAILLHNGVEEILILGTDLEADRPLGLIRFIPFPSEPQISLAPAAAFDNAAALLKKHRLLFLEASKGGGASEQPVELRFQARLGAHDMTLIKVHDPLQFRAWINDYFGKRRLPQKPAYPAAETLVADYVRRGIPFFVLDYVEVTRELRTIEPVRYRFASRQLYYPLKTSNTFGGQGGIDLILLAPGTLCQPSLGAYDTCLGFTHYGDRWQASTSAELAREEVALLDSEAGPLFGEAPVFIQMVSYRGDYAFDRDILADVGQAVPHAIGHVQQEPGPPWAIPIREIIREAAPQKADPRCGLAPDPGPCKGLFKKFYFDPQQGKCRSFFYGGCQGIVPFETMEECQSRCEIDSGPKTQPPKTGGALP